MLEHHLRRLALACGPAAAVCIVLPALLVVVSIASRLAGVYIGGLTEGAGYCMAAAGSLGLAYTFLEGEHIRVDIVLNRLSARARLRCEQLAVATSAALSCFPRMVRGSHDVALFRLRRHQRRFGRTALMAAATSGGRGLHNPSPW
ncbi:MAG: TRAP transporter small permease [Gammaproteobacteria bacterium]|nr:TRAP transporter small permease [Gammaproteobacteria bacterium]